MEVYNNKSGNKCNMCKRTGYHINFTENGKEVTCPHCEFVTELKVCEGFEVKNQDDTILKHDGKVYYCVNCMNLFALGCKHGINGCSYDVYNSILFTSYEENADGIDINDSLKFDTLKQFMTSMGNYKLQGNCSCSLDDSKEDIECEKAIYRGKLKNGPMDYSLVDLFEDKHPYNSNATYTIMLVCNSKNSKSSFVKDFESYLSSRNDIQYEITINPMEKNIVLDLSSICVEDDRTVEFDRTQTFYPNGIPYTKCPSYIFTPLYVTNVNENGEFDDANPYANKYVNDTDFNLDSCSDLLEEY